MYIVVKCLLSDRLKKSGISQSRLAELTNIPKSQISEYVNDKHTMSLESAKTIANALGCTIEELYQWKSVADELDR